MTENEQSLSIFISLLLRHKPEAAGIKLDRFGFALVTDFIDGINKTGRYIDIELLEKIVSEDNKGRYSFNPCKSKIRANQGHSVDVEVDLTETVPPDSLYHGTGATSVNSIMARGLDKRKRKYVHLSFDESTAIKVGKRHGKPVILVVDTKTMAKDGFKFFLSANKVWLTDNVPSKYISIKK